MAARKKASRDQLEKALAFETDLTSKLTMMMGEEMEARQQKARDDAEERAASVKHMVAARQEEAKSRNPELIRMVARLRAERPNLSQEAIAGILKVGRKVVRDIERKLALTSR